MTQMPQLLTMTLNFVLLFALFYSYCLVSVLVVVVICSRIFGTFVAVCCQVVVVFAIAVRFVHV